jgi:hypothetical protein
VTGGRLFSCIVGTFFSLNSFWKFKFSACANGASLFAVLVVGLLVVLLVGLLVVIAVTTWVGPELLIVVEVVTGSGAE